MTQLKIQITVSGPVGSGKGIILAKLKRSLEGDNWLTQATIEEPARTPTQSFIATKDID